MSTLAEFTLLPSNAIAFSNWRARQITVGTTPTQILAPDRHRLGSVIMNNGPATIWIGADETVTPGEGFAVEAGADTQNLPGLRAWACTADDVTTDVILLVRSS